MKQLLLSLFLTTWCIFSNAQTRTVTGRITDNDSGEGLPGVTISIKGTTSGVATDLDGNFSLNVSNDQTLVISYIGYVTQEIPVGAQTSFNVRLNSDISELSEVVIIGYGETNIRDATGSVVAVSSEDFNGGVISSPEQLIQGKMAGVQITSTSGAPGAGVELRVRGTNSVRSNNNPLFVVDGVPLDGQGTSSGTVNVGFGTAPASNPLSFLNPNDIESISVLKDASSTAIYGSRAANGVVFITTKTGRGKGTLEFASSVSMSMPANEYDLLEKDAFLDGVTQFGGDATAQDFGANTDWQDEITRTSYSHAQNLSYSKGFSSASIRASFGFEDQQGIIENSSLERITGRLNGTKSFLDDRLNIANQFTFSRVNQEYAPIGGSAGFRGDLLGATYSANPTWPASLKGLTDDEISNTIGGQLHPGNMLSSYNSTSNTNRILWNFSTSYNLTDDLTGKVTYGLDRSTSERYSLVNAEARNFDRGATGNGRGAYNETNITNNLVEATLTYDKEFGNSKLNIVGGYSYQDFGREGANAEGWGFTTTDFEAMETAMSDAFDRLDGIADPFGDFYQAAGYTNVEFQGAGTGTGIFVAQLLPESELHFMQDPGGMPVNSFYISRFDLTDKLQSFFGRINYTINNKYLFTFTARSDGSSRFGDDNEYGFFPSGALAWKLDEENFIGETFSTLKLRLGYGITGNQEGLGYGNFLQRQRYEDRTGANAAISDGGQIVVPGLQTVAFRNPELKWEETEQISIGLDFGLSNERLRGSIDYYNKTSSDILFRVIAAQPAPQPFIFENFPADVVNNGVELVLNYDVVTSNNFNFTAGFNIAHNENEIQNFNGEFPAGTIRGQGLSQAFAQLLTGDVPLFSYYIRSFEGFDENGQPISDDNQQLRNKSALPTTNAGLSLNLKYKNWDAAMYFAGQFGFYVYNNTANAFFTAGGINNARNVTPEVLTSGEAGAAEAAVSERFLEKGDFVRFQNLSIGYNFPVQNSTIFSNLKLYLNAQNLFLITDYSGLDPEVSSQPGAGDLLNGLPTAGIDYTSYPRPRVFTLGLNARF